MFVIIVTFIIIIALIIFIKVSGVSNGSRENKYKYTQSNPLFSPAERSFLGVLDLAVSEQHRVFGKVRVADILSPEKGMDKKNWRIAFNKISAKHFDYVLCQKHTLEVVAVIELDDKSHKKAKSIARDALLESACASASLALVRFEAKVGYQVLEVREKIQSALSPKIEESK